MYKITFKSKQEAKSLYEDFINLPLIEFWGRKVRNIGLRKKSVYIKVESD